MKIILKTIIIFNLLVASLLAKENEAKKLCDSEIKKETINKAVVKEQCLKTAKFYEDEKEFGKASWYYLLGGDNDYNTNYIESNISKNDNFSNIAHSYILKQNIPKAKELYTKFLKNNSIPWADEAIQDDYKLFLKLYPNQKEKLNKGLKLWNDIYKPLLKVNTLYPKYKKARKEKKHKEAIQYISEIIKLQQTHQNEILIVNNQYNLGVVYNYNRQYKKSLDIFYKVIKVYKQEKSKEKHLGYSFDWMANNYKNLQNNDKVLIYRRKSLAIQEKLLGKEHTSTVRSYNNIGSLYYKMGDYIKALNYLKKSLAIREKTLGKEHTSTATSYNNIGLLYKSMGDYTKTLNYYKKSLAIREKVLGKEHADTAVSYNNIGLLYESIGDYPKALNYFKKSLSIKEKVLGKQHTSIATSYNNIAGLFESMGDYKESLNYYEKSLVIFEKVLGKEHSSTATIYNNIGELYRSMGDYPKALNYYKKSLAIREKVLGKEHADIAVSYNNIGIVYNTMRNYPKALSYHKKSLVIFEKILGKTHPSTATSYNNIGSLYESMIDYPKAIKYYKKSLVIVEKVLGKIHPSAATSYNNLSLLYKLMKDYSNAYKYARKSYNNFIINRDKNFLILNNKQKELYLKSNDNKIYLLFSTAYLYKKEDKTQSKLINQTTLNDWLNYKGAIYDNENAMVTLYENTKDKTIKDKIDKLTQSKRDLAKLYQTLPKPKQNETREEAFKKWKKKIRDKEKTINDIENYISSKVSSFKEELGLRDINYKDISSNLKDKELYIDYAKAGKYYYLFTLDNKNNITFNQISKTDTKTIDKNVKLFRDDINKILNTKKKLSKKDLEILNNSSKKTLSKLFKLILDKPLKDILPKYNNLIISTDGALRLLPFEALVNKKNKYLIENKNIRYVPSGKELVRLYRANNTNSKKDVIIFSNPDYGLNLPPAEMKETIYTPNTRASNVLHKKLFSMIFKPLPGTTKEANIITKLYDNTKDYNQKEATSTNLYKVNAPKILHISTHGFFLDDKSIQNPMLKSGLAFSGANMARIKGDGQGLVTSLKLSGLNLKGTQLVVLSACQTGVVDINSTENVSGLNKAFIQAGVKNIVMSLWSVADKETAQLMSSFYKQMMKFSKNEDKSNKDYAQALREAKLKMINQNLHPFYWGAFVISGK